MFKVALVVLLCVCFFACGGPAKETGGWSRRDQGYYYRLLAFENMNPLRTNAGVARFSMSCSTLRDSVFWDSESNQNGLSFLSLGNDKDDFLARELGCAAEADSFALLVPVKNFFDKRFSLEETPPFCRDDTAVKVQVKVRGLLSASKYEALDHDPEKYEKERIWRYYGSRTGAEESLDPSGFYWISRPAGTAHSGGKPGDGLCAVYRGFYLSGRPFESGELHLFPGENDQLITGLNNVIAKLKPGQNAKIIIPSPLAYGAHGSSNGLIPPYAPLVYEIEINSEIRAQKFPRKPANTTISKK